MRILMVTDGSLHAEMALRLGAQIARRVSKPPTVLAVIKHMADSPPPPADVILAQARKILEPEVPSMRTRVRIGDPVEEIIREAKKGSYDLVIVGDRQSRNLITRFLRGSTAVRVAKCAPCSVIVVKGRVGPIHRILLCYSGAKSPSMPSRFTAQMLELLEGEEEVTILHVMSQMSAGPGVPGKQLRAGAEELIEEHTHEGKLLDRAIQVLERLDIHPRLSVRHGLVVDEIIRDAQGGNYDLVVIGAHRSQGRQNILLDDLAHKIIVQLDRPVLIVR